MLLRWVVIVWNVWEAVCGELSIWKTGRQPEAWWKLSRSGRLAKAVFRCEGVVDTLLLFSQNQTLLGKLLLATGLVLVGEQITSGSQRVILEVCSSDGPRDIIYPTKNWTNSVGFYAVTFRITDAIWCLLERRWHQLRNEHSVMPLSLILFELSRFWQECSTTNR